MPDRQVWNHWTKQANCILDKLVQTSSTFSSYNANMLFTHWCFSNSNIKMSYIVIYQSEGQNPFLNFDTLTSLHQADNSIYAGGKQDTA